MSKKPLIGICPLWDEEKQSFWMLPGYLEGILAAGGLPIMLPLSQNTADLAALVCLCDGFIFSGGQDVSPALYGESVRFDTVCCCASRDAMEQQLFALILQANKPLLGICRGLQLINVLLGGSLYQDLPQQRTDVLNHRQKPPYDTPMHSVTLESSAPLGRLLGCDKIEVNSYHHQAIKELAPNLRPMAAAPDGVIEAAYLPEAKFLWAIQWHPEFSYHRDPNSRAILSSFIAHCLG